VAGSWVGGLGTDLTQDGPDDEAKAHMGRGNIIGQGKGRTSLPSAGVKGSRVPKLEAADAKIQSFQRRS
jgi:hypothetical protein